MNPCQRPSTYFILSDAAGGVEGLGTNEGGGGRDAPALPAVPGSETLPAMIPLPRPLP